MRLTRRLLLRLAVWLGPLLALARWRGSGARAAGRAPGCLPPAAVASLARAYLRARPDEADPERLLRRLGLPEPRAGLAGAANLRSLAARPRADFRRGRGLELDGWTLSLTELRVAAWLYLERSRRAQSA